MLIFIIQHEGLVKYFYFIQLENLIFNIDIR